MTQLHLITFWCFKSHFSKGLKTTRGFCSLSFDTASLVPLPHFTTYCNRPVKKFKPTTTTTTALDS